MKRIFMWLIIAGITFIIGVSAAGSWIIYRQSAPALGVCDLIRNPDSYTSQTVRVRAVLFGHDEMGLYARDCEGGATYVHAIFDRATWEKFKATAKPEGKYYFMGEWDTYLVEVTLSGRFEKYTEVECDVRGRQTGGPKFPFTIYCYNFFVSDVERLEATNVAWPK